MKNDVLLIYPQDETTNFLQGIPDFLFERHGVGRFFYHRIGFSANEHRSCINLIEGFSENALVIFLGHGRSDALLGAYDGIYDERFDFVTRGNLYVFKSKKVFFLSCRSSELLHNQGIDGIGFGHILSSPNELNEDDIRKQYLYLFSEHGVPDSFAIEQFKERLVSIVCASLHAHISQNLTFQELYFNIKLRLNKAISTLIQENEPSSIRNLVNLLLKAKTEMRLFS